MTPLRVVLFALFVPLSAGAADRNAAPAPLSAEAGEQLYVAKCVACHGAEGKGNGPASGALPAKLPDFTDAAYWADHDADTVRSAIQNGTPGGVMRPFPMETPQLEALVAYVVSFKE